MTLGFWLLCGLVGAGVAAWRLRPSCLAATGTALRASRRGWAPPIGERPMLWKELYVERVGTLGRFGRWLGVLITGSIGVGSLVLSGIIVWSLVVKPEAAWNSWATSLLGLLLGGSAGTALGWLLQWAVGLRAAVSIASERERGTWDALLMSPLEPDEIGQAKLYGSIHALRWMAGAMLLAWTLGMVFEAVPIRDYVTWVAGNAIACAFMAAVGVRCSLSLPTATKAMTWTLSLWLAGQVVIAFFAISIIGIAFMILLAAWMAAIQNGLVSPSSAPWFPMSFGTAWSLTTDLVVLVITILIVVDTGLRFDRIAGRMAGGAVATTVDQFLHGRSLRPVFLPAKKPADVKSSLHELAEPLETEPAVASPSSE